MADTKVSNLTAASTLDGSELLHIVQGGVDRKATAGAIAGLITNEVIDDRVAALLQAGSGITITYDDASNTLTIEGTGGSSSGVTPNTQGGTAYTLVLTDAGKAVRCNYATAGTLDIPTNASVAFPLGTTVAVRSINAGQVTVTPASGVTLNVPTGMLAKTRAQHSTVMIHKVGNDEWDLTGDLAGA